MARCYSGLVPIRQLLRTDKLPCAWLVTDARNDAVLERALQKLPRGSGVIFRHYHLTPQQRSARFAALRRIARPLGHVMVWSGSAAEARQHRAEGAYGCADRLARGPDLLRLVTVHSLQELARAHRGRADALLLSPVYSTRSHPGCATLGPVRFRLFAARARVPVIALGGMNAARARQLGKRRWAAIQAFA